MDNKDREEKMRKREAHQMKMADCFTTAMFLPKEYDNLLGLKMRKTIGYVLLLVLLTSVIQYAIPALGAIAGVGGIKNYILNGLPDFALHDGSFFLDSKVEETDESIGSYLVIDTDVNAYTKEDVPQGAMQAIMISKTNMLFYSNIVGPGGMVQDYAFKYFKDLTITNETVAGQTFWIYACLVLLFASRYGYSMVRYLLMTLLYAGMLYLLTRTMMKENAFGKLYKLALFAQSIGVIVVAVTVCLNIPLLIIGGDIFHIVTTIYIMNRFLLYKEKDAVA